MIDSNGQITPCDPGPKVKIACFFRGNPKGKCPLYKPAIDAALKGFCSAQGIVCDGIIEGVLIGDKPEPNAIKKLKSKFDNDLSWIHSFMDGGKKRVTEEKMRERIKELKGRVNKDDYGKEKVEPKKD